MKRLNTLLLAGLLMTCGSALAQGTLEQIRVPGPSLAGNLSGDDAERDVHVYLPPGYEDSERRYPVIYFLHGYGVGAPVYVSAVLDLPDSVDAAMAAGAEEAIIVIPDAFSRYSGSMYANSPTTGNWPGFIARDLVDYIDSHYRTIPERESRGLSGHSMGGYGTLRIGMTYPDTFAALYGMSSCCLLNQAPDRPAVEAQLERMADGLDVLSGSFDNVLQAQAAAWAPNPDNPPYYFDLPYQDGDPLPLVQAKWTANSPLVTVDQHVPALRQYRAIMLDVGDADSLEATNTRLDAALTRLGIAHEYEVYEGDHGNRVGQRFIDVLLPFFAEHLDAE